MRAPPAGVQAYTCPVHNEVRQAGPGRCPTCGMTLQPENVHFALIRHMMSNPLPLIVMGGIMAVLMIAAMMMR
jgi:Heavy metal binding domain